MSRLNEASDRGSALEETPDASERADSWFDVTVLVENELTGTSARRMTELYQMKSKPLRYHLVRPLGANAAERTGLRQEAERLLQQSVERLEALQARAVGLVSDQEPIDALLGLATATHSQEVVVVTGRHRLATLLHRDLASQVRSLVDLPLVHLVER